MTQKHAPQDARRRLAVELLHEFRKTGNSHTALQLTGAMAPLVQRVVRRYQRPGFPDGELDAAAWSGLHATLVWLALGRRVRFETMARYLCAGEVSRYVRRSGAGRTGRTAWWPGAGRGSGAGTGEEALLP